MTFRSFDDNTLETRSFNSHLGPIQDTPELSRPKRGDSKSKKQLLCRRAIEALMEYKQMQLEFEYL